MLLPLAIKATSSCEKIALACKMSGGIIRINYSNKRITPFYINEDELMAFTFDEFKERLMEEVSHLRKLATTTLSIRLTVMEDKNSEVDLSSLYFNVQLKGLLEKEITVNVMAFDSPSFVSTKSKATCSRQIDEAVKGEKLPDHIPARRSLSLQTREPLLPIERYIQNNSLS